jgi:hypothetical protein
MRINVIYTLDDFLMRTGHAIERGKATMPGSVEEGDRDLMLEEIRAAERRRENLSACRELANAVIEEIALLNRTGTPGIDHLIELGLQMAGLAECGWVRHATEDRAELTPPAT